MLAALSLSAAGLSTAAERSCWSGGFNFHTCCLRENPGCWDAHFTFERCCPEQAGLCWTSNFNFETCCLANSSACWDAAGEYTFERCCAPDQQKGVPVADKTCYKDLVGNYSSPVLPDSRIAVSSTWQSDPGHGHGTLWRSRLESPGIPWCAGSNDEAQYIEWDFGADMRRITAVRLAGRFRGEAKDQFVMRFRLLYDAGVGYVWYDGGREVEGVVDAATTVMRLLSPFDAYRVRLNPTAWSLHIALRATLLGCDAPKAAPVALVYCWPWSSARPDLRRALWDFAASNSWVASVFAEADSGSCFWRLHWALIELVAQKRLGREATIVVSPLVLEWTKSLHSVAVKRAVEMILNYPAEVLSVVGLLWADADGRWGWPARKIRRQYWKLAYHEYPTGFARRLLQGADSGRCYGGDTVSGTRVYRSTVLHGLLQGTEAMRDAAWFVNLDLEALRQGHAPKSFTCAFGVLQEEDYALHADLTDSLARRYRVEAAKLQKHAPLRVNCQSTPQDFRIFRVVHGRGLVAPWCFRHILRAAWQALASWWHSLSPSHFILALDGTALSLLRNPNGLLPWDTDVDVILCANDAAALPIDVMQAGPQQSVLSSVPDLAELRALGFDDWKLLGDYRNKGAGVYFELNFTTADFRPGPISVNLDAIIKPYTDVLAYPLTAGLAGVEVRLSAEAVEYVVSKFGTTSDKRLQEGTFHGVPRKAGSLTCYETEVVAGQQVRDSACLPDCILQGRERECAELPECRRDTTSGRRFWCKECLAAPIAECEFPDRFIEIDYFD